MTPQPSRAMQWAGLIVISLLTSLVIIAPLIAAYITKNIVYLAPAVGTVPLGIAWRRLIIFLYKRKEDYELDELKIKEGKLRKHVKS